MDWKDANIEWETDYDGPWDELYPHDADEGYLYVIEFDSGWIKVGLTTNWDRRLKRHRSDYRCVYGWEIVNSWKSCLISHRPPTGRGPSELNAAEALLLKQARAQSDGRQLNPWVRGRGRDRSLPPETETFHGCRFADLVGYADQIARGRSI